MIAGGNAGQLAGEIVDLEVTLDRSVYINLNYQKFVFNDPDQILSEFSRELKNDNNFYEDNSPQYEGSSIAGDTALYFIQTDLLEDLQDSSAGMLLDRVTTSVEYDYMYAFCKGSMFAEPYFRFTFIREDVKFPTGKFNGGCNGY